MDYIIETQGVKRCFKTSGGEFWALKGIDMTAAAGELTILKGRSGSGKTTLMNIIGALDPPTEGKVFFEGMDITALDEKKRTLLRRKEMGFVFQSVALIPMMTALENVEYALRLTRYPGNRTARAKECLKILGLSQRANHMPQELSGGEQQRVAIARALAKNPKLLLCDEPTGALDYQTGKAILQLLQDMGRSTGMTVIIITHNSALTAMADRIIRVKSGTVASVETNANPVDIAEIEW